MNLQIRQFLSDNNFSDISDTNWNTFVCNTENITIYITQHRHTKNANITYTITQDGDEICISYNADLLFIQIVTEQLLKHNIQIK